MERENRTPGEPEANPWKAAGNTEAGSELSEKKDKKDKKSSAVEAWQSLIRKQEAVQPPTEEPKQKEGEGGALFSPVPEAVIHERAVEQAAEPEQTVPAEPVSAPKAEQAGGHEPPTSPPPIEQWVNRASEQAAETVPFASPEDTVPVSDAEIQTMPLPAGAEAANTTEQERAKEPTAEKPLTVARPQPEDVSPADKTPRRSGYERTTKDVSRAAWMGMFWGWAIGRRGKNKAVNRAVKQTEQRFVRQQAQQEQAAAYAARPAQPYEATIMSPTASYAEQKAPDPSWLRTETVTPVSSNLTTERMAAAPLNELLAVPAAVVAVRILTERKRPAAAGFETTLPDAQVLEVARSIRVDGVSLQQVYESKQIDKAGLRAVVETYLRGGSVEKQLAREVAEKQKTFERDPYMRKRPGGLRATASQLGSKLTDTGASLASASQKVASNVGRSVSDGIQKAKSSGGLKASSSIASTDSRFSSTASIVVIVIIYSLILFLWMTR